MSSTLQRQKRILTIIGALLIVAGIVIMAALPRLPGGLRTIAGLGDIATGIALIVLARRKPQG